MKDRCHVERRVGDLEQRGSVRPSPDGVESPRPQSTGGVGSPSLVIGIPLPRGVSWVFGIELLASLAGGCDAHAQREKGRVLGRLQPRPAVDFFEGESGMRCLGVEREGRCGAQQNETDPREPAPVVAMTLRILRPCRMEPCWRGWERTWRGLPHWGAESSEKQRVTIETAIRVGNRPELEGWLQWIGCGPEAVGILWRDA